MLVIETGSHKSTIKSQWTSTYDSAIDARLLLSEKGKPFLLMGLVNSSFCSFHYPKQSVSLRILCFSPADEFVLCGVEVHHFSAICFLVSR